MLELSAHPFLPSAVGKRRTRHFSTPWLFGREKKRGKKKKEKKKKKERESAEENRGKGGKAVLRCFFPVVKSERRIVSFSLSYREKRKQRWKNSHSLFCLSRERRRQMMHLNFLATEREKER